jgi:hypothetical protein
MHCPRYFLRLSLQVAMGLILGCSDKPTGMRGMQPGSGKEQTDSKHKKGENPGMPVDPPDPVAPPR